MPETKEAPPTDDPNAVAGEPGSSVVDDGELALDDERIPEQGTRMDLPTPYDRGLVRHYLTVGIDATEKLAKANSHGNYPGFGNKQLQDVAHVKEMLLSQIVERQASLDEVADEDQLPAAIANTIAGAVNKAIFTGPEDETEDKMSSRIALAIGQELRHIMIAIAKNAFHYGNQARETEPVVIVARSLEAYQWEKV